MRHSGQDLEQTLATLANQAGLLGLSGGISGDVRDLKLAAADGNADARMALDVYIEEIRRQLGSMLVTLGGCEALVFTGGIGENDAALRASVCSGLSELGIELDAVKNESPVPEPGQLESRIESSASRARIWIIPTNEELIVARQTVAAIVPAK
jgi:acetate kinase